MKLGLFLILLIIIMPSIYAECNSTQVDINSASSIELDKLNGIGPSKAAEIIDSRPFSSIDDLLRVNGIGEVTLNKIKEQGLVCIIENIKGTNVNNNQKEETKTNNQQEVKTNTSNNKNDEIKENLDSEKNSENENNKTTIIKWISVENINNLSPIKVIPKDIKINNSTKDSRVIYATYSLIGFSMLLLLLFMLRMLLRKLYHLECR